MSDIFDVLSIADDTEDKEILEGFYAKSLRTTEIESEPEQLEEKIEDTFEFDSLEDAPAIQQMNEEEEVHERDELFGDFDPEYDGIQLESTEVNTDLSNPESVSMDNLDLTQDDLDYDTICDSLYVYSKVLKEEERYILSSTSRKLNFRSYSATSNDPAELAMYQFFRASILTIINNMNYRFNTEAERREEYKKILDYLICAVGNGTESILSVNIAGPWAGFLKTDNERTKFSGGLLHLKELLHLDADRISSLFASQINLIEQVTNTQEEVPESLKKLSLAIREFIKPGLNSRPLYGENTLNISPQESYLRADKETTMSTFSICRKLMETESGRIVALCSCNELIDISDYITVVLLTAQSGRSSSKLYIKLRPVVCDQCNKMLIIPYNVIKELAQTLYVEMSSSNLSLRSKIEGKISFGTLYTCSAYVDSSMITTDIVPETADTESLIDYAEAYKEFIDSNLSISDSQVDYNKKVMATILSNNAVPCDIVTLTQYIYDNLPEGYQDMLTRLSIDNLEKYSSYVDSLIKISLLKLREKNPKIDSLLYDKSIIDLDLIPDATSPSLAVPEELGKELMVQIINIISSPIKLDSWFSSSARRDSNFKCLYYSGLGLLVESLLFDSDETSCETYLQKLFTAFVKVKTNKNSESSVTITITSPVNVEKALKKNFTALIAAIGEAPIDSFFKIMGKEIDSIKPIASIIYPNIVNRAFSNHNPGLIGRLNGEMNDDLEYLLECKNSGDILSQYLDIDTSSDILDSVSNSDDDSELEYNSRQVLLLAVLAGLDDNIWPNPSTYYKLYNVFSKLI